MKLEKFRVLGIGEETLAALAKKGFEEPSPIQAQAIPLLLAGDKNIIGQAQTGTGKTAAFGIPLVEKIKKHEAHTQAIVLAPTRELAIQVSEEIGSFRSPNSKINIATIYGGQSYNIQLRQLKKGADIIVGTPGRVIDMLNKKHISLNNISYFILDEADEMLNMGFIDDIEKILHASPSEKSMLLFSATMPREILRVAKKYMKDYEIIAVKKEELTTTQVEQIYFEVNEGDKFEALSRIIDLEKKFLGIVFCKTRVSVDQVTARLTRRGYEAEGIHGDVQQKQRERILKKLKTGEISILVATDVAARGIDVNDITHVINYSLPQQAESYVHRIGRTGRAGKTGTAITFVTRSEYKKILYYQRMMKTTIRQGNIPKIEDIIVSKTEQIKEEIVDKIEKSKTGTKRHDFAKDILASHDAEQVVSSLLALNYKDALSASRYNNIGKVNIDKSGTSRLFIALGRVKGYTAKTLVDYIVAETGVKAHQIDGLTILDEFSFINVPFAEAELILQTLGKQKNGGRPLVTKAKERKGDGGGRRNGGGYRGRDNNRGNNRGNFRGRSQGGNNRGYNRGGRDNRSSRSSSSRRER